MSRAETREILCPASSVLRSRADTLRLPHPCCGKITLREIVYLRSITCNTTLRIDQPCVAQSSPQLQPAEQAFQRSTLLPESLDKKDSVVEIFALSFNFPRQGHKIFIPIAVTSHGPAAEERKHFLLEEVSDWASGKCGRSFPLPGVRGSTT